MSRRLGAGAALLWLLLVPPVAAADAPRPRPAPEGPICDSDALVGVAVPAIAGTDGCGIAAPVEVRFAAGVALDPPPVMTCGAARALRAWLVTGVKPSVTAAGERLVAVDVAGAYVCRGRNGQPGAKLSEHGLGHAIDIGAFRFADGSATLVGQGDAALVATVRREACGPFATVLGPGSDAFHETHLHLDVAERRHGPYCQ